MSDETGEAIDARARLVAWALSQVGDRDPNEYYRVACHEFADRKLEHTKSWCGIFVLAGLHACGLCTWQWSTRASEPGFVFRLRVTSFPDVGDVAVFRKGADGKDVWHHAIVQRPPENGRVDTVDGNVLFAPREGVAVKTRPVDSNVTFYSIASLLRDP